MLLPNRFIQFCVAVMSLVFSQNMVFGDAGSNDARETIIAPQIVIPDDFTPFKIIAETPFRPPLNPPRFPLLRECAFCGKENREWFDDTLDVYRMAEVCGMDYLLLRFDRIYRDGSQTVKAAFFFSCKESGVLLDSVLVEVEGNNNSKRVRHIKHDKSGLAGLGLPAGFRERTEVRCPA